MIEADRLNREAALLSNSLADFAENDVAGRKVVVDQIIDLRDQWKNIRYEIDHGQPRQKDRGDQAPKPTEIRLGMSEEQIKLEVAKLRVNISKYKTKIAERPDHAKAQAWQEELARLNAMKDQYETELIRIGYETK